MTVEPAKRALSDRALVLWCAAGLFALCAWPLVFESAVPLQDLPNHLASEVIALRPADYPEYASNGLFKTNSALFLFLRLFGGALGLEGAGRAFVALVLGVNALAWPRAAYVFGGRERVVPAALLAWPLVHGWFLSMGMLDYALGAALGVLLLAEVERSAMSNRPSAWVAALGVLTWYAHAFALLLAVGVAVLIAVARARRGRESLRATVQSLTPLSPGLTLAAWSLAVQSREAADVAHALVRRPLWEVLYDVWALGPWAFTRLEASSLVAVVALFALGCWRRPESRVPSWIVGTLGALYLALPFEADAWFAVSARVLPFLYLALLARLPAMLPRWLMATLGASAVLYSIGLGVDHKRLSRELERYAGGVPYVPAGARVLPLTFSVKGSSENTAPLQHAWGLYVVRANAHSPPLAFGHSPSFPISYARAQTPPFDDLHFGAFVASHAEPACDSSECNDRFGSEWRSFWQDAEGHFDRLVVWDAPEPVLLLIPLHYHLVSEQGPLRIYSN